MMPFPPADDLPTTPRHAAPARRALRPTPAFWLLTMVAVVLGDGGARMLRSSLAVNLPAATLLVAAVAGAVVWLPLPGAARRLDCGHWRYWCAVATVSALGTACADIAGDACSGQASAAAIVAAAALAGLLWLLQGGAGTRRHMRTFWMILLGVFTAGGALGTAAGAPAADHGAAVLALSAIIASAAIARLGFDASRSVCCWIAYAALKPLAMAWTGLLLQPEQDSALNPGTVSIAVLLLSIVTLVVYLDAGSDRHHPPDGADGAPD